MLITVISTGWRSQNASVCRASVASQLGVDVQHIYIEASQQNPTQTKMQNLAETIATLPPDRVVALVDGDDFLAHRHALERIAKEHEAGAWVTYGSFVQSDGKPGFAAPYLTTDYRHQPWQATHLKTFRAGLFQRIRPEHLRQPNGEWIDRGDDPCFMWCCLELAGADRVRFIPDVLYVYHHADSWELGASLEERQHERNIVEHARQIAPYERVGSL